MFRACRLAIIALALSGSTARGQYGYANAVAERIHVGTAIMWNEYVAAVAKNENRENAAYRAKVRAEHETNYKKILERISNHPEERDVENGDALNVLMDELRSPRFTETSFRYSPVPLSADKVRRIRFLLNEQGLSFSAQRLTAKGKSRWPVALREAGIANEVRAYERVLNRALDQQVDGQISLDAIKAVEKAVDDLFEKLDQVVAPSKDKRYMEAKNCLKDLKDSVEILKSHKTERVISELDRYAGTNVRDLMVFMQQHKLRFGIAESPEERKLFPELYALLKDQRDSISGGGDSRYSAGQGSNR